MLKFREGNISLQLQWFLQFVPVIGSRELYNTMCGAFIPVAKQRRSLSQTLFLISITYFTGSLFYWWQIFISTNVFGDILMPSREIDFNEQADQQVVSKYRCGCILSDPSVLISLNIQIWVHSQYSICAHLIEHTDMGAFSLFHLCSSQWRYVVILAFSFLPLCSSLCCSLCRTICFPVVVF